MVDREKVMHEIERCINTVPYPCEDCSHYGHGEDLVGCMDELLSDALALLKEQEAVVRCKDCKNNNQCSIQFKFADADNPGNWFCADGKREDKK